MSERLNLLWLQSGGCGGCSMSLLGAEGPDLYTALDLAGIDLLWHPSMSEGPQADAEPGDGDFLTLLHAIISGAQRLDILCLEGSVMHGPGGTGRFHVLGGTGRPMRDWIAELTARARYTVAIGSCAAFGGITAAGGNAVEATGLQFDGARPGALLPPHWTSPGGLPVVNVAGCPVHPGWVTETLSQLAHGELGTQALDEFARPRSYTDHLVHHGCARNEFYEYKASAVHPSDLGCMMEHMGCLGTQARADCNLRPWNGGGSCLRGGYACINCTAPGFEEPGRPFTETRKIGGIPVGLPSDMPKAWFVALASLSKAATPDRLRQNAVADHIKIRPALKRGRRDLP